MKVLFRRVRTEPQKGDVVAIFLDDKTNDGAYTCYMHLGQHGACSPEFIDEETVETGDHTDKYGNLREELEDIGYDDIEVVSDMEYTKKKEDEWE